jgi:Omp85 superfamily domain
MNPINPRRIFKTTFRFAFFFLVLSGASKVSAQSDTTAKPIDSAAKKDTSSFDKFNKKAEALFKIIPFPIVTYSTDAGNVFGLAKFNLIQLSKKDTISKPSKLSEVVTFSTKGRINASIATELVFNENKYIVISFINYKKQPEYILGIGNSLSRDSLISAEFDRLRFNLTGLRLFAKNLYAGISVDFSDYYTIEADSASWLKLNNTLGLEGGWSNGAGFALAYDSRDSRYNPYHGMYIISTVLFYGKWVGSKYGFNRFILDARKYFNPWSNHVIALQATTTSNAGDVPFFEMAKLGGDNRMRGYYEGAIRDKVLVDAQLEYRMPVWKIFGLVGWVGTGRVADSYSHIGFDGFHISYGGGIRIKVDSKNNTNLRLDVGFGPPGVQGFYLNFAEAF